MNVKKKKLYIYIYIISLHSRLRGHAEAVEWIARVSSQRCHFCAAANIYIWIFVFFMSRFYKLNVSKSSCARFDGVAVMVVQVQMRASIQDDGEYVWEWFIFFTRIGLKEIIFVAKRIKKKEFFVFLFSKIKQKRIKFFGGIKN